LKREIFKIRFEIFKPAFMPGNIRRWAMQVIKAVNLFLDYHKMNSQKKYGQGV